MHKYVSKYFGELDLNQLQEWYESEFEYKGKTVTLDLNVEGAKQIEAAEMQAVDEFLDNLSEYEVSVRSALKKDLNKKGFTYSYIDIIKDEIDEEELEGLLAESDKKLKRNDRILSLIYLSRIGFYLDREDETLAVFDYTISEDLTNELLVVNLSKDKQIKWITVES